MKALIQIAFLLFFLSSSTLIAQYGYGNRYGRNGRQGGRTSIPQAQAPAKEPEAKNATQLVDEQMPKISKTLELDPFEEAVVRTTLIKYVQKKIELQILKLEPKKMQEEFKKLEKLQNEEIKAGLPKEKYNAYLDLQKNSFKKKKKKKKKKSKS